MSLSFEEMADSGLSAVEVPSTAVARSKVLPLVGLVCLVAAGLGGYFYLSESELPVAADILLSAESEVPGGLPHALDSATEFEESFDYLKEGEDAPEYRVADEVLEVAELETEAPKSPEIAPVEVPVLQAEAIELAPGDPVEDVAEVVVDRAPEIVVRQALPADTEVVFGQDWGGVVLVPDMAKLAKAYTSDVRLARVEAHPIDGEHLRVWARIQNLTDLPMDAEVGCEFRSSQYQRIQGALFDPMQIPAGGFVDVHFVSPRDRVESYTVMVKRDS